MFSQDLVFNSSLLLRSMPLYGCTIYYYPFICWATSRMTSDFDDVKKTTIKCCVQIVCVCVYGGTSPQPPPCGSKTPARGRVLSLQELPAEEEETTDPLTMDPGRTNNWAYNSERLQRECRAVNITPILSTLVTRGSFVLLCVKT